MAPGQEETMFDDLVASTKRGYAVLGSYNYTDSQALNGTGRAQLVYEIRDGKLSTVVLGSSYLYRAPEFWRNVVAIGGSSASANFGIQRGRDYKYRAPHTVRAVPAKVHGIAMIDMMRKA
jgi:predicted Zn-dependent protease